VSPLFGKWSGGDALPGEARLDVLLQVPLADLRGILEGDAGRRRRPTWPNGLVGERPGMGEFQPGFGPLRETLPSETGGWSGRAQHVPARRVIRLPSSLGHHLRRALEIEGYSPRAVDARVKERVFFGSHLSPRCFLQVRLRLPGAEAGVADGALGVVISTIANLPVRFRGSSLTTKLESAGPQLAEYWRGNSTRKGFGGSLPKWSISSGRVLCVLSVGCPIPDMTQSGFMHASTDTDGALWYGRANGLDVWLEEILPSRRSTLPLHLSRLHSERVVFETVLRTLAFSPKSNLAKNTCSLDRHRAEVALQESSQYLKRTKAFGRNQRDLLIALESDLVMHAAQWDTLRAAIEGMDPRARQEIQYVLQVMVGDNVTGDKFENIQGSTIVNRSAVQNAFNNLAGDDEAELRTALEEIAHAVDEFGDPDTSDIAESLIEESAGARRKPELDALWTELNQAAPLVGSSASAVKTIKELLA
jgi:hypothetical protein